jgi:hypothetical protein
MPSGYRLDFRPITAADLWIATFAPNSNSNAATQQSHECIGSRARHFRTHLYPRKNVRAGTVRGGDPCPTMLKVVRDAIQMGFKSLIGLPVAMLPPRLAVLRICSMVA